jgi:hypothetical protein
MRISELEQQLFSIREQCGDVDIVYINSNQTTDALRKNYLKVANGKLMIVLPVGTYRRTLRVTSIL